jgi:hypothetical protein
MKFEDIHKRATEDLKIDRYNLAEESVRTPNILTRYLELYRNEKVYLTGLTNQLNVMKKEKWLYYTGKADDSVYEEKPFDIKVLRQDLDIYLNADDDLLNLQSKIAMQKEKVFYLEKVIKGIEQREFSIKNAITMIKFEAGEPG